MTREEAVTVLKELMKNPLFSEVHKVAFNIAIHDIKQRHDWDINNLILVNKDDYESAEQESNIGKIRAEIANRCGVNTDYCDSCRFCTDSMEVREILQIIDKYKAESEG